MGYRRRAGGGKRDAAEQGIIDALRATGAVVWQLSGTSNPDLLILSRGQWVPCEVKTGKAGKLTRNQESIPWPVVRSVSDALALIGVTL